VPGPLLRPVAATAILQLQSALLKSGEVQRHFAFTRGNTITTQALVYVYFEDETGPRRWVVTKKKPWDFRPRARLLSPPNRSTAEPVEAIDELGGDELGRFLRVEH
jgi:hypothetical protein